MSIDATQFSIGTDMCGAIANACAKLNSSTTMNPYPAGATIDARGFTGNQVCAAGNITTMLFKCVPQGSSTGATSGKLLLGEVNLYADGPASGNYTGNIGAHPSGIGTPALIIPSFFWGIEGVSRGASPGSTATHPPPGQGTFLSVCSGTGKPINNTNEGPGSGPCTTAFPKRSFSISSNTVSGNAMTIVLTTTPGSGSLYPAELVMVKGSTPFSENGTYKLQSFSGATLTVTVPTGTGNCTGGCGTLL
ncbi:MAG: hypothetical protein WA847_00925 [Terriglobales bacterium]